MKLFIRITLFAWLAWAAGSMAVGEPEITVGEWADTPVLWTEQIANTSVIFTGGSSGEIVSVTPINKDENYSHAVWTFHLDQMTSSSQIVLYFDGDSSATLIVGSRGIQHLEVMP